MVATDIKTASRGRPPGPGPRFEENRNGIYTGAIRLFAQNGYDGTTMRAIATETGVSPGLIYRYFPSKEAIVLELYRRLSEDFSADARELPSGPPAGRFLAAMEAKLVGMAEYRPILRSLMSAGLNPDSGVYVLGPDSADIRAQVRETMLQLIRGSRGNRKADVEVHLADVLYVLHLALIFCWLHDPTPKQSLTHRLLALTGRALGIMMRFIRLGPIARLLRDAALNLNLIFRTAA